MFSLFIQSVARYLKIIALSFWPPRDSSARRSLKRLLIMLLFLPLFGLLQLCHWIGFLLDELFFRGYRKMEIREPVFVSGVPRSGTTLVHRTLAIDEQFTTLSTWECLFAPSVTQRRFIRLIAGIDSRLGKPLGRLLKRLEQRIFPALDDVHEVNLADAEEDYFVFLPVLSCFILVVPFPYSRWLWDIGQFDRRIDPVQQKRLLTYYRRCVQKHLYASAPGKRFLSKNASFAPLLGSLIGEFPDARFVFCLRDPLEVVASQLSSLRGGMEFFCNDPYDANFRDKIVDQLAYYYRNLIETPVPEQQRVWVEMRQFKTGLSVSVEAIYAGLGIEMPDDYAIRLSGLAEAARRYSSGHSYRLDEFGLDPQVLRARFADSAAELGFDRRVDTGAQT